MKNEWIVSLIAAISTISMGIFGWLKRRDALRFTGIETGLAKTKQDLAEARQTIQVLEAKIRDMEAVYQTSVRTWADEKTTLLSELRLLRASVARMEIGVTAATVTIDTDGLIVDCNPMLTEFTGWTKEDLQGQSVRMLVPFRFRQEQQGTMHAVMAGDRKMRETPLETFMSTQTGSEIPVRIYLSTWQDDDVTYYGAEIRRRTI